VFARYAAQKDGTVVVTTVVVTVIVVTMVLMMVLLEDGIWITKGTPGA
jgi:hypothetical protein